MTDETPTWCRTCGAPWAMVQRGQCAACGSDEGSTVERPAPGRRHRGDGVPRSEQIEALAIRLCNESLNHSAGEGRHDATRWGPCSQHEADAPSVAAMCAQAAAEALTATADSWQWKGWADVLIPSATGNPIANGQRVTEWLRARAALADPTEATT